MGPRTRKLVGFIGVLAFLIAYVGVVAVLADHVPNHWLAHVAFFGVAGTAWGVPLLPLFRWMSAKG